MLKKTTAKIWKWAIRLAVAALIIAVTIILVWAFQSRTLPELDVWHDPLDGEMDEGDLEDLDFEEYLYRETELFATLEQEVYFDEDAEPTTIPHRYKPGSPVDPRKLFDRNWNRTAVLEPEGDVKSGAVLLHGLTDGPYSMKAIGELLQAKGCYTVCLRMPGHGTVPGALLKVDWEDWYAALEMAVRHVREKVGEGAPLYLGGYSTGGSIALKYAIAAVDDDELVAPRKVFLLGPPVRVHPLAGITRVHKLLSWMPYFEKFRWLGVQLEFDPYKYNSFPKNGGVQSFHLSRSLIRDLRRLQRKDKMGELAPVVTFQSVVDATVLTNAVVNDLYMPMSPNGSELILFDVNRYSAMEQFLRDRGRRILDDIDKKSSLPFRYTLISSVSSRSREAQIEVREQGAAAAGEATPLGLLWPSQVYSLSHVALPFRPDDPVYGYMVPPDEADHSFRLGAATPRGERALLRIPMDLFMRLRSNPFFEVVEERILSHLEEG